VNKLLNLDKKRIVRILIIAILFLGLMLLIQWYLSKNVKLRALESALLEYKFVEGVEIAEQTEKVVVYLSFGSVNNLKDAYDKVCSIVEKQLNRQPFEVKIVNSAISEIEDVYYNKVQFIIYEALETGEFTKMRERLDEIETISDPLKIQVFLDSNKLYLHMVLNESNFYKIVQREV